MSLIKLYSLAVWSSVLMFFHVNRSIVLSLSQPLLFSHALFDLRSGFGGFPLPVLMIYLVLFAPPSFYLTECCIMELFAGSTSLQWLNSFSEIIV